MKLLDRINRTGTTVVMATHDHGIVNQMRKRVVELSAGQVVRDQPRAATASPTDPDSYAQRLRKETDPLWCPCAPGALGSQGLRRNLTMHLAVVLTLFVSLTFGRPRRAGQPADPEGHRLLGGRAPDHLLAVQGPRQQPPRAWVRSPTRRSRPSSRWSRTTLRSPAIGSRAEQEAYEKLRDLRPR